MCAEKLIVLKKVYQHSNQFRMQAVFDQFHYRWFHILFFLDFPDDDTVVGGQKADKKLSATNVPQKQRVELIIESINSASESLST